MTRTGVDDVTIRPARAGDRDAIIDLLAVAMGSKADDRYRRFYAWKHDENPVGTSPTWVAERDDELVGLRVWLRWQFENAERTWTAVRAVDTATHPSARGQGIFTRLTMHGVEELTADGVDFVFNTPNEKSRPGYRKMGWVELGTLPTAVRFSSASSVLRTVRARQPADRWSLPIDVGAPAREVFAGDGAAHWLASRPAVGERLRTVLDPEVLRWRYGLDDLHYRVLTDDTRGCVVFRLRRRGPATEAVVCLVLARTAEDRLHLLRLVAKSSRADHVMELTDHPAWSAGFMPLPGQGPVMVWRPLSWTEPLAAEDFDLGMGDVELL